MLTEKGVISSAIVSAIIAGIGLVFFALFIWKRKDLDPPSYIDLENANMLDGKGPPTGEKTPELPMQHAERTSPVSEGSEDPFADFAPYGQYPRSFTDRTRGHSRNISSDSSVTANDSVYNSYNSYRETLQKRALLTDSVLSTDSTCRDSVSDHGSKDIGSTRTGSCGNSIQSIPSLHGDETRYSQTSERIFISDVRMPPQFSTPTRPPSAVSKTYSAQCEFVLLTTLNRCASGNTVSP